MSVSVARALVVLNGACFITTWFLSAFYLLAVAPLALASGRRIVGWSAVALAAFTLVGAAASPKDAGQFSSLLVLFWILGRHEHRARPQGAAAGVRTRRRR